MLYFLRRDNPSKEDFGPMWKPIMKIKKFFNKATGKKICSKGSAILNCLEYREDDVYIAHCLEFDLVAQGDTPAEARKNLADIIKAQVQFAIEKDVEDKSLFHPAPVRFWQILSNFRSREARHQLISRRDITVRSILQNMSCTYAHI